MVYRRTCAGRCLRSIAPAGGRCRTRSISDRTRSSSHFRRTTTSSRMTSYCFRASRGYTEAKRRSSRTYGSFIQRYVDFSATFKNVATHYVLLTWPMTPSTSCRTSACEGMTAAGRPVRSSRSARSATKASSRAGLRRFRRSSIPSTRSAAPSFRRGRLPLQRRAGGDRENLITATCGLACAPHHDEPPARIQSTSLSGLRLPRSSLPRQLRRQGSGEPVSDRRDGLRKLRPDIPINLPEASKRRRASSATSFCSTGSTGVMWSSWTRVWPTRRSSRGSIKYSCR